MQIPKPYYNSAHTNAESPVTNTIFRRRGVLSPHAYIAPLLGLHGTFAHFHNWDHFHRALPGWSSMLSSDECDIQHHRRFALAQQFDLCNFLLSFTLSLFLDHWLTFGFYLSPHRLINNWASFRSLITLSALYQLTICDPLIWQQQMLTVDQATGCHHASV